MSEHSEIYQRLNRIEATQAAQAVEIQHIRSDVQELLRAVVRGNGQSIATRLSIVERDLAGRMSIAQEGVRGRWSAVVAGIAAAGAIVGGLITSLASRLFAGGGS